MTASAEQNLGYSEKTAALMLQKRRGTGATERPAIRAAASTFTDGFCKRPKKVI